MDYAKAFDCVDHNKLWKILQEMGIRDHLTCLLRNLYAGQEATVRTGHVLGARVRYSARDKGHEEGGSTYTKAGLSLRSPPGTPRASTP